MSSTFNSIAQTLKAWVVFSGQADRPWLRFLRPGFRHCFVILHDGQHWLSFDPMLNHIDLQVHSHVPDDFDLPDWLRRRGQLVITAPVDHTHKNCAPVSLFTCVEAVKRVLGLHRFFILTPWQLYCHLSSNTVLSLKDDKNDQTPRRLRAFARVCRRKPTIHIHSMNTNLYKSQEKGENSWVV